MKKRLSLDVVVVAICLLTAGMAKSDVKLPAVLGSHMVVQQNKPVGVWGWASPGEVITVLWDDHSVETMANDKGDWKVSLPVVKADGKPHRLTIQGKNKIELEDILVGEVWLGAGQSNMEWPLVAAQNTPTTLQSADHPQIRLFHIPRTESPQPAIDIKTQWKVCSPKTARGFSAVLYFFGRRLHQELGVPVGLINSSWGGSRIEPWTAASPGPSKYNGMIAPLKPLAIRGVLWYQGESNIQDGLKYKDKMQSLIGEWRQFWGSELPFYYVQLAPWSRYSEGALPPMWEAQTACLKIPHTGMAVTTDLVDNLANIHPKNKLEVGNRLALWALARNYGKSDLVYSGPLYKGMTIEGDKIRLSFAHAVGLKSGDSKPLNEFEIASSDGKFVPAEATIDGMTVVVRSKDVVAPREVRFAWRNVARPNLCNAKGIPAASFRSKDWQGGTGE